MAMTLFQQLVQEFVTTNEKDGKISVEIFEKERIEIKKETGSCPLKGFWENVLRSNYPEGQYEYTNEEDGLFQVTVDRVSFQIGKSARLIILGKGATIWTLKTIYKFSKSMEDIQQGVRDLGVTEGWDEEELERKLPAVKKGKKEVYEIWKSLLSDWFSQRGNEVYLATPFLDSKRIKAICDLFLRNIDTAKIAFFFTRELCNRGANVNGEFAKAIESFGKLEKEILENEVLRKICYKTHLFHGKYIACIADSGTAKILLSSANFHSSHFDCENLETVSYHEMSDSDFLSRFVEPLQLT